MIKNERQYRITKHQAHKFRVAISEAKAQPTSKDERNQKIMRKASIDAMQSQLQELEEELRLYDDLQTARGKRRILTPIDKVGPLLIMARIARGWTQHELAEKLGLKMQQIQQYEATDYERASLTRLMEVIQALGLTGQISATLVDLPSLDDVRELAPVATKKRKRG